MSLAVGSVTVDDAGVATGSGYAKYLYDIRAAQVPDPFPVAGADLPMESPVIMALLPIYEGNPSALTPDYPLTASRPADITVADWARLIAAGMVVEPASSAVKRLEALRGVAVGAVNSAIEIVPYLVSNAVIVGAALT